jgi:FixJ family two-component response regulator
MSPTTPAGKPILVVDDEEQVIVDLTAKLRANGLLNVSGCRDSREVVGLARSLEPALILLDLRMPYLSGEELLGELHALFPQLPVIVLTATDEVQSAVGCMQAGAVDYMVKPVEDTRLLSGIRRALEQKDLASRSRELLEVTKRQSTLIQPKLRSKPRFG